MADVVAPLTDEERGAIRDAVRAAERTTSGEIFVVVAQESDDYRIVPPLWAMLAALIVPLPLVLFTLLSAGLTGPLVWPVAAAVGGVLLGGPVPGLLVWAGTAVVAVGLATGFARPGPRQ